MDLRRPPPKVGSRKSEISGPGNLAHSQDLRVEVAGRLTVRHVKSYVVHRHCVVNRDGHFSKLHCSTPLLDVRSARCAAPLSMLAVRRHPDKRLLVSSSVLQRMGAVGISSDRRSALWIVLASAILCLGVLISVGLSRGSGRSGNAANDSPTVTVMTRNIYLGGNIDRPIRAALDRTGPEGVLALGHANHELRNVVDRTDFGTRSGLLADEIAAARPDLIGLQEVALWRHGPLQLDQIGLPNATEVDYDFLATLVADLATRGIRYDIVGVQQQSDVEAPAFTGNPFAGAAGSAEDVRLTDRDVRSEEH